jgi:hypothetical protein
MKLLERLVIVLVSFAIAIGVIVILSGGPLAGRDNPELSSPGGELGMRFRDLGDAHLSPGAKHPRYDSQPPTSGPHVPVPIRRDRSVISDDQLLQALAVGNIVVMYGTRVPHKPLPELVASIAAPFSPRLAAAGQAVILVRRPGTRGLIALAWTRLLRVASATDPRLRSFVLQWLGRGADAAG